MTAPTTNPRAEINRPMVGRGMVCAKRHADPQPEQIGTGGPAQE